MAAMHTGTLEEDGGNLILSSIDDQTHGPVLWFHLSSRHNVGCKEFLQMATDRGKGERIIMIHRSRLWIGYKHEGVTKDGFGRERLFHMVVIPIQQECKQLQGVILLGDVCLWRNLSSFVEEECFSN